jgi:hypothetical protein
MMHKQASDDKTDNIDTYHDCRYGDGQQPEQREEHIHAPERHSKPQSECRTS